MQQLVHGSLHIRHSTDVCRPSNADARMLWRRKATASAFSTANMKAEFPNIRAACSQLIEVLKSVGPDEVVDMDGALCRESLDVIGEPGPLLPVAAAGPSWGPGISQCASTCSCH